MENRLKIYRVTDSFTGKVSYQAATNTRDACQQAGWLVENCYVVEQTSKTTAGRYSTSTILVKIPCKVCPFQYAECQKPEDGYCPVRPNAPELAEWLKQAARVHMCPFVGDDLRREDYENRQKWVKIEEAIKELASKLL